MTKAQEKVIAVLRDCGGWVCFEALRKHGASAAAAAALVNSGHIERRQTDSGFGMIEWRLPPNVELSGRQRP